jgi:2-polyprenyl-3-methyl-5-hydroxy-6-metoxy-1,4-benzoquinol methylase
VTGTPGHLAATAAAYDAVAARYAEFVQREVHELPLDRALLAAFAEHVQTAGGGLVADLGCGEGRIGAHLAGLGLDVLGIDLSTALTRIATVRYPGLRFAPAYRWPAGHLSALASQAGFAEVGRMSREPRDRERFRRGHLLLHRPS